MKKQLALVVILLVMTQLACETLLSPNKSLNIGNANTVRGSGNVTRESREVGDFNRIQLAGIGDVELSQGEPASLEVEADDNIAQWIQTEVRGDTLVISIQGEHPGLNLKPTQPIRYYVTVPDVRGLEISGSGNIRSGSIDTDQMDLSISGSGDIQVDSLSAKSLESNINGSGSIEVKGGEVSEQNMTIAGSGNYSAAGLESQTASVTVSGSGSATVRVAETLNARIPGSGNIRYYGSPNVNEQVAGSGRVRRAGD